MHIINNPPAHLNRRYRSPHTERTTQQSFEVVPKAQSGGLLRRALSSKWVHERAHVHLRAGDDSTGECWYNVTVERRKRGRDTHTHTHRQTDRQTDRRRREREREREREQGAQLARRGEQVRVQKIPNKTLAFK